MTTVLAALAVAICELDAVQAGQLAASRPLVMAPLLGSALGRGTLGVAVGAACELFSLRELPVGGRVPLNATIAAGGALLLACGTPAVPAALALPAGLALGWAHREGETWLRGRRDALGPAVEARVRRGAAPSIGLEALRSLAEQALLSLALLAAAVGARGGLLWAWEAAPGALRDGAAAAWFLAPWLGLAGLGHALVWERRKA